MIAQNYLILAMTVLMFGLFSRRKFRALFLSAVAFAMVEAVVVVEGEINEDFFVVRIGKSQVN